MAFSSSTAATHHLITWSAILPRRSGWPCPIATVPAMFGRSSWGSTRPSHPTSIYLGSWRLRAITLQWWSYTHLNMEDGFTGKVDGATIQLSLMMRREMSFSTVSVGTETHNQTQSLPCFSEELLKNRFI